MATTDTVKTSLAAAPFPSTTLTNTHVYTWDTFASGFFDQSDNVVLRLKAYPGTGVARNGVPDANQWPYAVASTSPVRVRGTQIQVFSESKTISNTVAGAYVFRLPADAGRGRSPVGEPGVPGLPDQRTRLPAGREQSRTGRSPGRALAGDLHVHLHALQHQRAARRRWAWTRTK